MNKETNAYAVQESKVHILVPCDVPPLPFIYPSNRDLINSSALAITRQWRLVGFGVVFAALSLVLKDASWSGMAVVEQVAFRR